MAVSQNMLESYDSTIALRSNENIHNVKRGCKAEDWEHVNPIWTGGQYRKNGLADLHFTLLHKLHDF